MGRCGRQRLLHEALAGWALRGRVFGGRHACFLLSRAHVSAALTSSGRLSVVGLRSSIKTSTNSPQSKNTGRVGGMEKREDKKKKRKEKNVDQAARWQRGRPPPSPRPHGESSLIGGKGSLSVPACALRSLPGQPRQCANYCQLLGPWLKCGQLSAWNKERRPTDIPANAIHRGVVQ